MGNWFTTNKEPPPPMVLVPPLFDFPPLAARTRMLESSYNLLFGKLSLRCLFEDYFEEARRFSTRIMLKPIDDPHVDLIATVDHPVASSEDGLILFKLVLLIVSKSIMKITFFVMGNILSTQKSMGRIVTVVSGPLDHKPEEKIVGNAQFRWQRVSSEDYGVMGLRYGSSNLSFGATLLPFSSIYAANNVLWWLVNLINQFVSLLLYHNMVDGEFPKSAWLVPVSTRHDMGTNAGYGSLETDTAEELKEERARRELGLRLQSNLVAEHRLICEVDRSSKLDLRMLIAFLGLSCDIHKTDFYVLFVDAVLIVGSKDGNRYKNLANWSCAIGYGLGSGSPLSPSFNFGLELAKSSQVKNPLEENEVVGITNYIDFGFELQTRIDDDKPSNVTPDSSFQVAASWQANKNFLLKGKVGPLSSSMALAFKSWWKPSFTFNISATRDRTVGKTAFGFGIRVDNVREASYQRADPNFVMLTPNKEHLAEGIHWKIGKRPVLQSDLNSGNFDGMPRELRPLGKFL
ncbi:hypothetical protein TEA_027185 [Camellia sinensis var. sinensis]|uniref:Uncharacterized protein n=1 Tax=Camellia sinensis var. sinensis TaxID=542762 RepID=A0A4S4E7R5_CAMSN|nr:hypothetical protein TEA_027185 [Camellia sinensis var. sinensis]